MGCAASRGWSRETYAMTSYIAQRDPLPPRWPSSVARLLPPLAVLVRAMQLLAEVARAPRDRPLQRRRRLAPLRYGEGALKRRRRDGAHPGQVDQHHRAQRAERVGAGKLPDLERRVLRAEGDGHEAAREGVPGRVLRQARPRDPRAQRRPLRTRTRASFPPGAQAWG